MEEVWICMRAHLEDQAVLVHSLPTFQRIAKDCHQISMEACCHITLGQISLSQIAIGAMGLSGVSRCDSGTHRLGPQS